MAKQGGNGGKGKNEGKITNYQNADKTNECETKTRGDRNRKKHRKAVTALAPFSLV